MILMPIVALLAAAPPSYAASLRPHGFRQPSQEQQRSCPDLRRIDYRAVEKQALPHLAAFAADDSDAHRAIRGTIPYPDTRGANPILSATANASMTQQQPTRTSSVLWRDRSGRWMMDRVDFMDSMNIEAPQGVRPFSDEQIASLKRRHWFGPLSLEQAKRVEGALASRCFRLEPDWLSLPIPALDDGGPPFIEGYRGSGGIVHFESRGVGWSMYQDDPRTQFRIILSAVLYARPEPASHLIGSVQVVP